MQVPLTVEGGTAFQLDLQFDHNRVDLDQIAFEAPSGHTMRWRELSPGLVRILGYPVQCSNGSSIESDVLSLPVSSLGGTLDFDIDGQAEPGTVALELMQVLLVDPDAHAIAGVLLENGAIEILESPELDEAIPVPALTRWGLLAIILIILLAVALLGPRRHLLVVVLAAGVVMLLAVGANSFSYDARGNRTSAIVKGESIDYQWDAFGRLVGVTTPDGQAEFEYDIDQRRVARVIDGERTRQLVDPQSVSGFDQVVAEYNDSGQVQAHWHYGRQVLAQHRQGSMHYYGTDHHGSVRLLTDSDGLLTDRYDYLPFGDLHLGSGNTDNPYRFNAERYESAARSYDMRARSYDSCSGTFVSRDPFQGYQNRPFSLHPYQFADADPIDHIDPLGLATLVDLSIAQHMQTGMIALNIGIKTGTALCKAKDLAKIVNTARVVVQAATVVMSLGKEGTPVNIDLEWEIADDAMVGITLEQELATGEGKLVFSFSVESGRNAAKGEFGVGWGSGPDDVYLIGGGGASRKLFGIGACLVTVATLNANVGVESEVGRQRMNLKFIGSLSLEPEERIGGVLGFGGFEYQIFEVPPIPFR